MSKAKYKRGRLITSLDDFDKDKSEFYIVHFGFKGINEKYKTMHVSYICSWQYRFLREYIRNKRIYKAVRKDDDNG